MHDNAEDDLTPEQKERNWMMLWKVRENKFSLPLRMILNVPKRAFFDPFWGPLLQPRPERKTWNAQNGFAPQSPRRGFFSDIGPGLVGIDTPIDAQGPATFYVWYTPKMGGRRDFVVEGVSLEEAREAALRKAEEAILAALAQVPGPL